MFTYLAKNNETLKLDPVILKKFTLPMISNNNVCLAFQWMPQRGPLLPLLASLFHTVLEFSPL